VRFLFAKIDGSESYGDFSSTTVIQTLAVISDENRYGSKQSF